MKPLHFFIVLFPVLLLTACKTPNIGGLDLASLKPGIGRLRHDDSFEGKHSHYLERGYLQLSEYEEHIVGDEEAASHFKEKSKLARKGDIVTPDRPSGENLSEDLREEMRQGRTVLLDVVEVFNMVENAAPLAEAQVNYDCWLERIEEGNKDNHGELCREHFYGALRRLKKPATHRASVYFGSNETTLNDQAIAAIQSITSQFPQKEAWRILLVGRTDKNGSYADNVVLSMRRAMAVRNALAQHGIDPDKIVVEVVGEGKGPVDGGNDNQNMRRVDMEITHAYMKYEHKGGPDVHKAFPHFFGANNTDM
jgi:OmpA-OmpF porin, OOP family